MTMLSTIGSLLLSALTVGASQAAVGPDTGPALADECAYPAGWAPPFTHGYALRNGATLVFVGVDHTRDPADASHRLIAAAFDRYRPVVALVEGVAASKSGSDAYRHFLVDAADRDLQRGAIQETLFTVKLAHDRGIDFTGWDFSPDELYAGDVADGIAIDDALGAHLVRAKVDPADTAGGSRALAREAGYAARVQPIGPFDYQGWYRRAYGASFDPSQATPCGGGVAGRIAKAETRRRNLNIAALIERAATPGKVVLIEAGANHWLALRPYLQSLARSWN